MTNPYIPNPDPYFKDDYTPEKHMTPVNDLQLKMQRLCYETFILNESGKELLEMLVNHFVMEGMCTPEDARYPTLVTYFDGYKEAFRGLRKMAIMHEKRGIAA